MIDVHFGHLLTKRDLSRCKRLALLKPDKASGYFMCKNLLDTELRGEVYDWDLYTPEQHGYKSAIERIPYFNKRGEK